jgi:hypothetical protein
MTARRSAAICSTEATGTGLAVSCPAMVVKDHFEVFRELRQHRFPVAENPAQPRHKKKRRPRPVNFVVDLAARHFDLSQRALLSWMVAQSAVHQKSLADDPGVVSKRGGVLDG